MPARDSVTKHCHLKSGTHSGKIRANPHDPCVHGMQGALRGKVGAPFPAARPREWQSRLWARSQPAWFQTVSLRSPWQTMNLCLSFLMEEVRITSVPTSEGCREDRREWGPGHGAPSPRGWHCGEALSFPSGKQQMRHHHQPSGPAGPCRSRDWNSVGSRG